MHLEERLARIGARVPRAPVARYEDGHGPRTLVVLLGVLGAVLAVLLVRGPTWEDPPEVVRTERPRADEPPRLDPRPRRGRRRGPFVDADVVLHPVATDGSWAGDTGASTDAGGRFDVRVAPGTWRIEVRLPDGSRVVGRDLDVAGGGTSDVEIRAP